MHQATQVPIHAATTPALELLLNYTEITDVITTAIVIVVVITPKGSLPRRRALVIRRRCWHQQEELLPLLGEPRVRLDVRELSGGCCDKQYKRVLEYLSRYGIR